MLVGEIQTLRYVEYETLTLQLRGSYPAYQSTLRETTTIRQLPTTMFPIPNEILDEIVSHLDPLATSCLLRTCRSFAFLLTPAMHLHAEAPKNREPALHWASRKGHLPLIQYLLTRFPVDLEKDDRSTPLQAACWSCTNTLSVEYLLLHGAAVNHTNRYGLTALYYACRGDTANEDIAEPLVRLLLAHGANAHNEPHAPLIMAVGAAFTRVTRLLLEAGANPDVSAVNGEPVLVSAARSVETVGIVELLLDHGADINALADDYTALMMAARGGALRTLKLLLARGANLDCEDHQGNTLLHLAIMHGHRGIAEYLVGVDGVELHRGNHAGDRPWDLARRMCFDTVILSIEQSERIRGQHRRVV